MRKSLLNILKFRSEVKKYKNTNSVKSWQYFNRWKKTLDGSKSSLYYQLPWINFEAIEFLEKELKPGQKVFEYGGGGSSLFFLLKGCLLTTVEHDEKWFPEISREITQKKLEHLWEGFYITPEKKLSDTTLNATHPLDYYSRSREFSEYTFKNYASKIDGYADSCFDLVLVDGRARPSCVYHSIHKIKPGGLLIIDNTERDYYLDYFLNNFSNQFSLVMDNYAPVPYISWFNKTSIWRRK